MQTVARHLGVPRGVAFLPDGSALVTERRLVTERCLVTERRTAWIVTIGGDATAAMRRARRRTTTACCG